MTACVKRLEGELGDPAVGYPGDVVAVHGPEVAALCLGQPVVRDDVRLGISVRDDDRPGLVLGGCEPGSELGQRATSSSTGSLSGSPPHSEV